LQETVASATRLVPSGAKQTGHEPTCFRYKIIAFHTLRAC
jgi:hypothetical protein